jgi:hypothetical protein
MMIVVPFMLILCDDVVLKENLLVIGLEDSAMVVLSDMVFPIKIYIRN